MVGNWIRSHIGGTCTSLHPSPASSPQPKKASKSLPGVYSGRATWRPLTPPAPPPPVVLLCCFSQTKRSYVWACGGNRPVRTVSLLLVEVSPAWAVLTSMLPKRSRVQHQVSAGHVVRPEQHHKIPSVCTGVGSSWLLLRQASLHQVTWGCSKGANSACTVLIQADCADQLRAAITCVLQRGNTVCVLGQGRVECLPPMALAPLLRTLHCCRLLAADAAA